MIVWGVIWMVAILLVIVSWYIYYILRMAYAEMNDGSNGSTESEELLQFPSDENSKSTGRGYDRCSDRSWIRFIQERTGKNCGS